MTAPAVELVGVSMRRGERLVLDDVSLQVHPGECVALLGPNGAGKSTIVSLACGDLTPTQGTVRLAGDPIASIGARDQARLRAVMSQHTAVAFGFTVREVVAMGREPWRNCPESEQDETLVEEALSEADVLHLANRPVQALSGGEQARVALARTLAQATPVLVWDEPTAALDLKHQVTALASLRGRVDDGAAAVLVVHDLTQASLVADRVALILDGRVVAEGEPGQVLNESTIESVYGVAVTVVVEGARRVIAPKVLSRR